MCHGRIADPEVPPNGCQAFGCMFAAQVDFYFSGQARVFANYRFNGWQISGIET